MKRKILCATLLSCSASAFAVSPGGDNCGWGNMLFEGQAGIVSHFLALTTNGTSGNATFGMTTGTNGCSTDGNLTYGGKEMVNLSAILDEFSEDAARGQGEAMNAVAVSLGIEPADRTAFSSMVHDNFSDVFPHENVTAAEVLQQLIDLMKQNEQLEKYIS